ncbi:MAG TPA: hypothetical protein VGY48_32425 [Vicinamibacterales bacterium]|nr:hypothetical protein [Vicinamibacterales bacterium]
MQNHRILSSLALMAALLVPVTSQAAAGQDGRRDAKRPARVYDRAHKDYHTWDANEDHVYRQYLGDNHQSYRGYSKLSRGQQKTYWNFRHTQG